MVVHVFHEGIKQLHETSRGNLYLAVTINEPSPDAPIVRRKCVGYENEVMFSYIKPVHGYQLPELNGIPDYSTVIDTSSMAKFHELYEEIRDKINTQLIESYGV